MYSHILKNNMKETVIRYLPLFLDDLTGAVSYIRDTLQNDKSADDLVNTVEEAIINRSNNPTAFEQYHSTKEREYPYYRIYVKNFIVYYVVIPDEPQIMEIRRFLYNRRNQIAFL